MRAIREATWIMSASTVHLRLHNGQSHNSSLTFYSHGRAAKAVLSRRLVDAKSGGNIDILPTKMTNGFSGEIRKAIDRVKEKESEKESKSRRRSKTYVSCLQTSLSIGWKKSLSQETDESELCEQDNDRWIIDMDGSTKKQTPRAKETETKTMKGTEHRKTDSDEQKSQKAKPRPSDKKPASPLRGRTKGKRSELQDSHVSVQPSTGRQLMIISHLENGAVSVTTYGDGSQATPKSCTSYVYIKSKFQGNQYSKTKRNTVVVQKPPLCRSITISEASLSSAITRQAEKMAPQNRSSSNLRKERSWTGINVQKKSKRSFTVSNDSTDGRLRTIYESTMEENCE